MDKFRVFFIHRSSERSRVRELQDSLAARLPNFPFEDASVDVPYVDNWKGLATAILSSCAAVVCFVSEDSHRSEPIDWEIREARRLGKPLVVVTLSDGYQVPPACTELQIDVLRWDADAFAARLCQLLVTTALFRTHDWTKGAPEPAAIASQYALMVQSCESLDTRRQTVNTMYISANSALLAGIGILISSVDKLGHWWTLTGIAVLAFLGAALSWNWRRTVASNGTLSSAKWTVVTTLEAFMPARLFDTEWRVLEANHYTPTKVTDGQTALFVNLLFVAVFLVSVGVAAGRLLFA